MKTLIKTILLLCVVESVFLGCSLGGEKGVPPTYLGMTVECFQEDRNVQGTEAISINYHAKKSEKVLVNIHFDNPEDYLILSFQLNDIVYSTLYDPASDRYFVYNPEYDTITIHLTMDDVAGLKEYVISNIRFIYGQTIQQTTDDQIAEIVGDPKLTIGVQSRVVFSSNHVGGSETDFYGLPGSDFPQIPVVSRSGYVFINWFTDTACQTGASFPVSIGQEDAYYYADWEKKEYTVEYTSGSNGTIAGEMNQTVSYLDDAAEVTAIPDDGYHFVSWSDGVTTAKRIDTGIQNDMSCTANFSINEYTVSFNSMGGSAIASQVIEYDRACPKGA